jgi:hypothetical protein
MVVHNLPKVVAPVRFRYPAQGVICRSSSVAEQSFRKAKVASSTLASGSKYN